MALSSDMLNTILLAATLGQSLESTGVPITEETKAAYKEVVAELEQAPAGVGVQPVFDWADDRYDDLIERSQAAHGGPRSLDEMTKAASMSLVSKAAEERRFTLGPMYVPDRVDAHGEWTDSAELQKAVWEYVRKGDRRIRLQHNRDVVAGEWVEIMTFPYEMAVPMNKADGTRTELAFPKDTVFRGVVWEPWAWDLVKSGKLSGYSIGGKAERLYVDLEDVTKEEPTATGVHVDSVMGNNPSAKLPSKRKKKSDVPSEEQ
jgi:hypothetical protein